MLLEQQGEGVTSAQAGKIQVEQDEVVGHAGGGACERLVVGAGLVYVRTGKGLRQHRTQGLAIQRVIFCHEHAPGVPGWTRGSHSATV